VVQRWHAASTLANEKRPTLYGKTNRKFTNDSEFGLIFTLDDLHGIKSAADAILHFEGIVTVTAVTVHLVTGNGEHFCSRHP